MNIIKYFCAGIAFLLFGIGFMIMTFLGGIFTLVGLILGIFGLVAGLAICLCTAFLKEEKAKDDFQSYFQEK